MFFENINHHSKRDMAISGPGKGEIGPVLKGMGFRGTSVYGATNKADRVSMYIETADRQILFSGKPSMCWAELCRIKSAHFPGGFAVREVNGEVVQTTYAVTVTENKPKSKHKKASKKIRWP